MKNLRCRVSLAITLALICTGVAGCEGEAIEANRRIVQQQQSQIEQMQQEIETLKTGQAAGYRPGVASTSGGCDRGVEATASQRGGDRFAAGDFGKALAYYQDALAACPDDAQAELNVARAYEALGDGTMAIDHYRTAARPVNGTIGSAQEQARAALRRLQVSDLP